MPLKRKHSYKSKTQTGVAEHLVLWAVEATQAARQSLLNAKSTGSIPEFNAASARFAAVLEELPELWPELSDELMQAVWLGFDEAMRTRLAEGAAGSLFGGERPCNLPQLLCLISRALTDEGRYWTARSLLHRARRVAQRHGISESLVCASLADMHCRAVPPWHFHMLNDQPRNQAFAASIGDALRELAARTARVEPVTCLDIGTGTGLLALICQQLGSELGMPKLQIHACEENELLFAMASELINSAQSTGLEEKEHVFFAQVELKEVKPTVILHRANSRNLEVPPVDLIFCEAVDAELVGEGFLQTALDACERLLKPDGRLIPSSATLFGQLVECPCLQARFGCDHFQLTSVQLRENFVCDFLENLEHKILSGPAELMHIPFDKPKDLRCQLGFVHFVELQALQSGTAHAVMVWWELRLDKHGRHKISSRPGREENHWPQVFWPVHAEAHVSDEEAEPAVLPKLGRTLLASECVALQLRLLEDRLECKPRTFGPSKVPKSKFKISSGDLQWLNDAQVWECLKQQCQAIKVYGYGALLDGSALVQPAALLTAASSLDAAPTVRAAVANGNLEAIEAFLRANSFGDEPVLFPDSPVDDAVKLALSSEAFGKAASIILVLSDVVKRSGEVRSELLHKAST
ncbi:unnamed protein product [Durusdinium trenchii]|uniref:Protein arginine N-methyltransferase domain-containing protein n=1 Tax=Durusdinium trenchii TaxID=1381693 RepID=A0ABP0KXG2_9DINO